MAKIVGEFGKGTLLLKEVVWAKPTNPGNVSAALRWDHGQKFPLGNTSDVCYFLKLVGVGQKRACNIFSDNCASDLQWWLW